MSILKVDNLKKTYIKNNKKFVAVNGVDLEINRGECVGLVGESGCGKTTVSKIITGLEKSSGGSIFIDNEDTTKYSDKNMKNLYQKVQMIFQNPVDSFNPRVKLGNSIGEININFGDDKKSVKNHVLNLLNLVGLKDEYYDRYPNEVSGGECQRAAIARALAIEPNLIVCDEPTSALDVSVQAQIINLLKELQDKKGLSYLFISHDLALVQNICQKIYVMYQGNIVEWGSRDDIVENAKHPYTKLLLSSIFHVDNDEKWELEDLDDLPFEEEVSMQGCKFYTRCSIRQDLCNLERPDLVCKSHQHYVACHII